MAIPLRLKIDDAPEVGVPVTETVGVPVTEGELSALAEAQVLELVGILGGIRTIALRMFDNPNHRLTPDQARAVRLILSRANEGVTIAQAVTMSTSRRGR